jgi:hypothetical protein
MLVRPGASTHLLKRGSAGDHKVRRGEVMSKIILSAAAALTLAACGTGGGSVDPQAVQNGLGAAIDEKALMGALNQSIDRKAVEGMARGAVAGAVQEAIPAEVRAAGAVIDEQALAKGIDRAVDGNALGAAALNAFKGIEKPAGQ